MTRAMVTNWASNHAISQGDYAAALALSDQVRAAAAELQNPVLRAIGLDGLAVIHWEQGNIDRAEALFDEELELCTGLGMTWLQCASLYRLAGIQIEKGFLDYAQELAEQALVRLGDDVNIWMQLRVLEVLGRVALERGDLGTAREHLTSALEMASRIEDASGTSEAHVELARLEADRDNGRAARRHLTQALDMCENTGELLIFVRVLEAVVGLRALARPEAVLNLGGAATTLRTRHGVRRLPLEQARYEAALERALTQVRRAAGETALVSGQSLGRVAAAQLARELLDANESDEARAPDVGLAALTRREAEIAALVARGLTNRAIGAELFIAEGTVRAHVEHILAKLELKSRVEVAARLG
jgi:non-specific serine/threonine protein kinase